MVDVSGKAVTSREAVASGKIVVGEAVMQHLKEKGFQSKKGSILQTAIIAGTMSVKKTYEAIPFCHQIPITGCKIEIEDSLDAFHIMCRVKTQSQTGVEMEALQGVSTAALTIYDMCKALSHDMEICDIKLIKKTGGKSDYERKTS